jgi:hypothetical protein
VKIKIPREMVFVDEKTGKVSLLANPLTKTGNLATRGGELSIQLETDPNIDEPQIVDPGNKINTYDARERGRKYKGQIKEAKDAKKGVLDELKRDAGKVRTRAIVPVESERSIIPVSSETALVPLNREEERAIVPVAQRRRRPRLQPVDVDDGGLDGYIADMESAPTRKTTRRPIDAAISGAMSRLDSDLRVAGRRHSAFEELSKVGRQAVRDQIPAEETLMNRAIENLNRDLRVSSRRHDTFKELQNIGRRALDSGGVEEHKSPEAHELLRQRQSQRRDNTFRELQAMGQRALQQTRQRERSQYNAQNYQQNRNAIRQHRNERIQCECGDEVMRTNMARHLKTQRHRNAMG